MEPGDFTITQEMIDAGVDAELLHGDDSCEPRPYRTWPQVGPMLLVHV